jgi:hypothetical protein
VALDIEVVDAHSDPEWRLWNLYYLKDEHGRKVKFVPNWAQEDFLRDLWFLNLVLKSRQLGFTTVIDLFMFDAVLWNPHINARVIADSDAKAIEIFDDKIRFAYENLPYGMQMAAYTVVESMHELKFGHGSSIKVGTSARGLTEQYLHVSELGKISLDFPKKAQEIKTGAFNTVHPGNFIFVESTAKGRGGVFFELCDRAGKDAEAKRPLTQISGSCTSTRGSSIRSARSRRRTGARSSSRTRTRSISPRSRRRWASSSRASSGRGTSRRLRRWGTR